MPGEGAEYLVETVTSKHQPDNEAHDAIKRIRKSIESVHGVRLRFSSMPCQASPSFPVLFLFIILFFALRFFACPQFTSHGPFFSIPSEVEKPLTDFCISRSMSSRHRFTQHERMLEIAVLCWGRNNMKKFMPSMSIQASVIQPSPLLAAAEVRGRA